MKFKAFFVYIFCYLNVSGQMKIQKELSTGFLISTSKNTPFLLRSNQFGTIPMESGIGFISSKIVKDYDSLYNIKTKKLNFIDYGFGIEPHVNLGMKNQFILPQVYIKARIKAFEFFAGRRREIFGLVDTAATSGSFAWSGNALPVPKIEISMQNYIPILGKGLVSIKGNFAHGWFGSTDSVKNYYLHQKTIHTRIGKPSWKAKVYLGINHNVQWGGKPTIPFIDKDSKKLVTTYGNDFATFMKVASAVSLGNNRSNGGTDGSVVVGNEVGNRAGNHLGTVDIALDLITSFGGIYIYRQSIFDDGSLFYLNNIPDGLNGVSFRFNQSKVAKVGFEYLNTSNQGGDYFYGNIPELRGRDNYFNNSVYPTGWTYRKNTIGNPFLNSKEFSAESPSIYNNMLKYYKFYLGFGGFKGRSLISITSSKNLGNIYTNISQSQLFFTHSYEKQFKNFNLNISYSVEKGEYWKNNAGVMAKITKQF